MFASLDDDELNTTDNQIESDLLEFRADLQKTSGLMVEWLFLFK